MPGFESNEPQDRIGCNGLMPPPCPIWFMPPPCPIMPPCDNAASCACTWRLVLVLGLGLRRSSDEGCIIASKEGSASATVGLTSLAAVGTPS